MTTFKEKEEAFLKGFLDCEQGKRAIENGSVDKFLHSVKLADPRYEAFCENNDPDYYSKTPFIKREGHKIVSKMMEILDSSFLSRSKFRVYEIGQHPDFPEFTVAASNVDHEANIEKLESFLQKHGVRLQKVKNYRFPKKIR